MNLHANPTANTDKAAVGTGEVELKIVDFVPSAMVAEEEVAPGGGVTLKLQSKPEHEKVSPRPDFDLDNYLNYTKMIGKLATRYTWQSGLMFDTEDNYLNYKKMIGELAMRYTWQSVLMFDIEYWQHQAAHKFAGVTRPHTCQR